MDHIYNTDDPIAALATPWGQSALAVVRTSGKGVVEKISALFKGNRDPEKLPGYSLAYGKLADENGAADEVVLGIYRAPKSYTGEDMVEIFCHGSLPGIKAVLELLKRAGFRDAQPGEFTLRSFLSGKIDLTRAEAVNEIITSKSRQAQVLALNRLAGNIYDEISRIKFLLADITAAVEIQLDYAEDEADPSAVMDLSKLDEAGRALKKLSATYETGKLYKEGIRIAFAGKTNAGKSALFNYFLKEERSIVSSCRGTTRDYIEASAVINGIPAVLIDTAGLRRSSEDVGAVEAEGIRRSGVIIENADIILYIVDASDGISPEDEGFLKEYKNSIPVWNKTDISDRALPDGFLPVSAVSGEGFETLKDVIYKKAEGSRSADPGEAVIDSLRQKELIDAAFEAVCRTKDSVAKNMPADIVAVDLREAVDLLGELTGEITSDDILKNMFSHFCVGK